MIRVYLLPIEVVDGVETVVCATLIHDALLETTKSPDIRKLIMDTTDDEDLAIGVLAIETPETTQEDIDRYNAQVIILPPDPDTIRAEEILATSPEPIPVTELSELARIFGRRLGYRF